MYKVHQAMRSSYELGTTDDAEYIRPDLWIDPDYLSVHNFC